MTFVYSKWPFTGRDGLAEEIASLIGEGGGAVLVGEPGIGKTSLARHALEQLAGEARVVYIRGTAVAAKTAYGALGYLLNGVDKESLDHPIPVLRSLARRLSQDAAGGRVFLFVDNAQELDDLSAMAIAHLARNRDVTVLAVCEDILGLPEELGQLWKDRLLRRVDVGPLNLLETTKLLHASLGSSISRSAAQELWETSGGNPLFLQALTREQIENGLLVRTDGIWLRTATSSVHGGQLTDLLAARLDRLPAAEREAVELVSLSDTLTLEVLQEVVDPGVIDRLQERGTLEVQTGIQPKVRMKSKLTADVVRGLVRPGRSLRLLNRLGQVSDSYGERAVNVIALASWMLDCGAGLEQATALEAAHEANNCNDPVSTLRFLAAIEDGGTIPDVVIEEARALTKLGRYAQARGALDRYEESAVHTPLDKWAELALARCILDHRHPDYAPRASKLIEQIRTKLELDTGGDAPTTTTAGVAPLIEQLELVSVEMATFQGRYREVSGRLWQLYGREGNSQTFQLCIGGWLCEAWALTGRQSDAVALAADVFEQLRAYDGYFDAGEMVSIRLFNTWLWAGLWDECLQMLQSGRSTHLYQGSTGEMAEGLVHALAGRSADALELILPAVRQVRVGDVHGLTAVGLAAAAYAYSLQGESELVRSFLAEAHGQDQQASWPVQRTTAYFLAAASAVLGTRDEAAVRMLTHADEDRRVGTTSQELFFLSAAVRLGHHQSAARLVRLASGSQGRFAVLCRLFGEGVSSRDSALLLRAATAAGAMGNEIFCRDAAALALELAVADGDRDRIRSAQKMLASSRAAGAPSAQHVDALPMLTAREREIALRAARGEASRTIAADLSVSVRTVEGHLYQIYEKLHVNNRGELVEALA